MKDYGYKIRKVFKKRKDFQKIRFGNFGKQRRKKVLLIILPIITLKEKKEVFIW